jgi:hypothetical protein
MKLVMTLRTHDQEDIIDAVLSFHLNIGVDYVIATDHRSQDGTVDILEEYARAGVLHLIREYGEEVRGREWRTRMARMAAVEHGADWTFSCDGDEFWWPHGNNLKEVLSATPKEFGVVLGLVRHFLPISARDAAFAERMTVRFSPAAPLNNPLSPYRPYEKVAHRGDPGVVVHRGNHHLHASRHAVLRSWYPIEVLHFPVRSAEQAKAKNLAWARVFGAHALGTHLTTARSEQRGDVDEYVATFVLPERVVQRGLAEGSLVEDVRLRDFLRQLARTNGGPYIATAERSDRHLPVMRRDLTSWLRDRQSVLDRRTLALVGSVDQLNRRIEALETLL